ncbi:FecR family protein [uncultured Bacteroides sp.]|mgnify:FL=1|jgi:transmembrane sensor|uniref:FecR family protein n=1 Tax=unclassified Bacteroides TaxID=2646097 RepID=UPI00033CA8BF|nr:FecR family protein [uncultured Bacteroides sp.]CDA87389.1 putative anti-sigma factor [Bacteroides sp. CAG:754]
MKNYFQKILTLFTGHEYPESTGQEFYRWLVDKEHLSEKDEALQNLWEEALKQEPAPNIHRSYEQLRKNAGIPSVRKERRIRPIHIWQAAAAVFFIVAASSVYLSTIGKDAEPNLLQQYIPTAEMRSLTLPDGTKVQLNSQSTLLYPQEFTGKDRSVFLIGEANFKVKPDKKHPFIVKSNDFQVTALGTEFNVAAYPENPIVAATLISGSVLVEYNELNSQMILKPNEQLAYNKHTRHYSLSNPDMKDVTAWQHGELVFREMSVKDIITVLERKYPYTFEYQLKSLKEDKYSFRFKDQATLSEVMDVIVNVVGQMDYKIKEGRCYLIPK